MALLDKQRFYRKLPLEKSPNYLAFPPSGELE